MHNPSLEHTLTLQMVDELTFVGQSREGSPVHAFGGEVAAQALVAAGRTVSEDRLVHSLHGYFLRAGDPGAPLRYEVDATRTGGSFTTRRVVALQAGKPVFILAASFHRGAAGFEHQLAKGDAAEPERLAPAAEALSEAGGQSRLLVRLLRDVLPLDVRFPEEPPGSAVDQAENGEPRQRLWLRTSHRLSDAPLMHAGAATYMSDLFLLASAIRPHRAAVADAPIQAVSLDHSVWFHTPFRSDEWLLYEQEGFRASAGRALARGMLFDRTGTHCATVMQEGLLRGATPPATG